MYINTYTIHTFDNSNQRGAINLRLGMVVGQAAGRKGGKDNFILIKNISKIVKMENANI